MPTAAPADALALELLGAMEAIHQQWLLRYGQGWHCGAGCTSCCTQSVTITAIEGRRILNHLAGQGRPWTPNRDPGPNATARPPLLTTNQLARLCLDGVEPPATEQNPWDFIPCPFLEERRCSIYPARPFMCRAFVSRIDCAQAGEALVEPLVVTANTVFLQLLEHLGQGEVWGALRQVLDHLASPGPDHSPGLALAEPLPGFLIPPEEQRTLDGFFHTLSHTRVRGKSVWQWLQEGGFRGQ